MPYASNTELPKGVKNHLPAHAQAIYREAFNHAWEFYRNPRKRKPGMKREETAHSVAWAAVESKYHKDDKTGEWVQN